MYGYAVSHSENVVVLTPDELCLKNNVSSHIVAYNTLKLLTSQDTKAYWFFD